MTFSFGILNPLKNAINIDGVKSLIDGKVLIGDYPKGKQKEHICLNILKNGSGYMQSGYINLNIYTKQIAPGRPNIEKTNDLLGELSVILEELMIGNCCYEVEDDKGFFEDTDNDGMFFYNIRLKFYTT